MTINFLEPDYIDEAEVHPDAPNMSLLLDLIRRYNEQCDRLELLFMDIQTDPTVKQFGYSDVMHWKARANWFRTQGDAKRAKRLEQRMALKEAKDADCDEEFMTGYKDFLANEFVEQG